MATYIVEARPAKAVHSQVKNDILKSIRVFFCRQNLSGLSYFVREITSWTDVAFYFYARGSRCDSAVKCWEKNENQKIPSSLHSLAARATFF
jgi:hypothetical protein